MYVSSRRLAVLCLAALLALAPGPLGTPGYADDRTARAPRAYDRPVPPFEREINVHLTDQVTAQTQVAALPRRDVAFSLTHRVWGSAPRQGDVAGRQELARLRLSQRIDLPGQQAPAFKPLAPAPLWADLLLEARAAPSSRLHLSTTAAYHPATARLARATTELKLQPLNVWTLSLASAVGHSAQLERLTGGVQLTLSNAWTISYVAHAPALDVAIASHTVTTWYRSPYGPVRLLLAQSPVEMRVGIHLDVTAFLHHALGF